MKYIINLTISFDLDSRKLSLYNDERIFIELSKPATRLLMELIKNNRLNASREELLNNVWINYGFTASNAGLNNYISELRKSFITLEMNREVTITIPKIGFRLDADIQTIAKTIPRDTADEKPEQDSPENTAKQSSPSEPVKQEEQTETEEVQPAEPEEVPSDQALPLPIIAKFNNARMSLKVKALLFTLPLLLVIAFTLATRTDNQAQQVFLYNEGQCKVSTLGPDKGTEDMVNRAKTQIAELNINCVSAKRDIFYIEERPGNNVSNRVFIAVCDRSGDNTYSSCENFKNNKVIIR